MPKSGSSESPAGGSGNSSDCRGKPPKQMAQGGVGLPAKGKGAPGQNRGKQTGSNVG